VLETTAVAGGWESGMGTKVNIESVSNGGPMERDSRFEFLAENATDMISRHAPDGTYLYTSGASERLFGYRPEEMVGRAAEEFFHPDEIGEGEAVLAAVVETPEAVNTRFRFRRKDGTYAQVESTVRRSVDEEGRVVEIHAVTRDVSAQTASEELRRQWEMSFTATRRGIAIVDPKTGALRAVNPALAEMHGGTTGDFVGRPLASLFTTESAEQLPELIAAADASGNAECDCDHVRLDGGVLPVRTEVITVRDSAGEAVYRIGWFEDLTEQRQAERERARTRRDFEIAFRYAPNGVAIIDLDGRFVRVNPKICEITGYAENELEGHNLSEITHPDDLDADLDYVEQLLAGEITSYEMEKRYFTKQGHLIWILLSGSLVRDDAGAPEHFIVQVQDISQRKRMEASLRELADKDVVTGLMNRRRFEEELDTQAERCARYGERVALILLDLDKFKQVNDSQGHKAGDRVIRAVGRAMLDRVRDSDVVARIGGDEFALLLLNISEAEAARVAEDVRELIEQEAEQRGDDVTASVGVVHVDGGRISAEGMLVAADMAMYEAKHGGRNRVAVAGA
jgi:diguanylate cyclase (GGDEF)-like protein/PAS domain S-box-containing protein